MSGELVYVRRQPGDHQTAAYRVEDVDGVRFDHVSGGVNKYLHQPALCGYVLCDEMVEGDVAHSCRHGPAPHRIKVVIPKICNDPQLWARLAGREYREPKPLNMSPEAVQKRKDRALKAARTRSANRAKRVEALVTVILKRWPTGRLPSAEKISSFSGGVKSEAADARRKVVAARAMAGRSL